MGKQTDVNRTAAVIAIAVVLAALSWLPVRAEDTGARPSPRTAVEIGGASVVLVAANDKIYAFIDRLEDNAPVSDAALSVDLADGSSLKLTRVSDGLFVAPFSRAGHMQDAFMVSLVSPDGTGDGAAEIGYDDVPAPEVSAVRFDLRANATVALVAGATGAALATAVMLLARTRRRRAADSSVGSAAVA
jgi:hypothetical protein